MVCETSVLKGKRGQTYQLGKEIGNGGEGRVFVVEGKPSQAVKIYKKYIAHQEDKLKYMVEHPIPELPDSQGVPIVRIAWPQDVLYDEAGSFVGYVMPLIEGGVEIFEIHRGCTGKKSRQLFPNYSWLLNVTVAHNLAVAVDYLHMHQCIIGDMNCKNILVDQKGSIVFLDVDSFDIRDRVTGTHYKCGAGTEDYLPPELQGRDLRRENAQFTVHTDDFALAIHIFQLLMDNFHPFSCIRREQMKDSANHNPRLEQIGSGSCPFVKKCPGMDIPPSAPMMKEILPEYLVEDFSGTFDYDDSNVLSRAFKRTPASTWARDLEQFRHTCENGGLLQCEVNPKHLYLESIGHCGHCAAQKRLEDHLAQIEKPKPAAPQQTKTTTASTTTSNTRSTNTSGDFSTGDIIKMILYGVVFLAALLSGLVGKVLGVILMLLFGFWILMTIIEFLNDHF